MITNGNTISGGLKFTEGQVRAYNAIASGRNVLLLGTAGSGKSTLLDTIRQDFGHETLFCGTTGVSNQLLFNGAGGHGTAHRLFSIPMGMHNAEHLKKVGSYTQALLGKTDTVKRVVIDEGGMLTPDQFAVMCERVKRFNKPTNKRKARNIQTIIVGDLLQIPPVLSGNELKLTQDRYYTKHFFKTALFKGMDFEVVFLNQVMRSPDPEFKSFLNVIRYGDMDNMTEALKYFNKRVVYPLPKNTPMIVTTNKAAEDGNSIALASNKNPCGVYTADIEGSYDMKNCPVEKNLRLKVGMPVITLINAQDGSYQNGSCGKVESMTSEGVYVHFENTQETHLIEHFKFEEKETYIDGEEELEDGTVRSAIKQRTLGSASCIPIKLASAMTTHRMQGKTLATKALVDFGWGFSTKNDFGTALVYVGLSRFTDVNNIFLKRKIELKHIKVCRETIEWLKEHNAT